MSTNSIKRKPIATTNSSSSVTTTPQKNTKETCNWVSTALKPPILVAFLVISIGIIVAITVLLGLSKSRNGFAALPNKFLTGNFNINNHSLSFDWNIGLLWTSVPTFVVSIYSLWWGAVASAIISRQPYLGLMNPGGVKPQDSIFLDYRTILPGLSLIAALKRRHFLVAICMLSTIVMSLLIIPLSSRLFVTGMVTSDSSTSVLIGSSFDDTRFTAEVDLGDVLDITSANLIYGAGLPPWMTAQYAFPSTTVVQKPLPNQYSMSANVTAYSATLDCIPITDYNRSLVGMSSIAYTYIVSAVDRDCRIQYSLALDPDISLYVKTTSIQNCSPEAGSTRLVLVSGTYSNTTAAHIDNFSFVSCITNYWNTSGLLTTAVTTSKGQSSDPVISSFTAQNRVESRISSALAFEQELHTLKQYDPSAESSVSQFGRLIYKYSLKTSSPSSSSNTTSPLDTNTLINATSSVFNTTYAVLANNIFFKPLPSPTTTNGSTTQQVTRLFIVSYIAYILITAIFLLCVMTIVIMMHTIKHKTMLAEEPVGFGGYAEILMDGDDVNDYAREFRATDGYDGKFNEYMKGKYDLSTGRCCVEESSVGVKRVRLEDLVKRRKPLTWYEKLL